MAIQTKSEILNESQCQAILNEAAELCCQRGTTDNFLSTLIVIAYSKSFYEKEKGKTRMLSIGQCQTVFNEAADQYLQRGTTDNFLHTLIRVAYAKGSKHTKLGEVLRSLDKEGLHI